jgi:predicted solute-binding protein
MDWEGLIAARGQRGPLRFGAIPAFYAEPLLQGLRGEGREPVVRASADVLTGELHEGTLAAALVPVIEAAGVSRGRIVPGLGVCAREAATGERLLCRVPPTEVRTLAAEDAEGGAVSRILLAELYGARPEVVTRPDDADAVVQAGNAALEEAPAGFAFEFDLGELWTGLTGLPSVLAVWTLGLGAPVSQVRALLGLSAQSGLDRLDEAVAQGTNGETATKAERARARIEHTLAYRMGAAETDSLRRLMSLGEKHGLCRGDSGVTFC